MTIRLAKINVIQGWKPVHFAAGCMLYQLLLDKCLVTGYSTNQEMDAFLLRWVAYLLSLLISEFSPLVNVKWKIFLFSSAYNTLLLFTFFKGVCSSREESELPPQPTFSPISSAFQSHNSIGWCMWVAVEIKQRRNAVRPCLHLVNLLFHDHKLIFAASGPWK